MMMACKVIRCFPEQQVCPWNVSKTQKMLGAAHTLFRFFWFAYALFRRVLMATKIRTLSPTFLIPRSLRTAWSHSSRLSPLKLLAIE
jgi:hypothetical protein